MCNNKKKESIETEISRVANRRKKTKGRNLGKLVKTGWITIYFMYIVSTTANIILHYEKYEEILFHSLLTDTYTQMNK